jgi:uncharacterized protein YukE
MGFFSDVDQTKAFQTAEQETVAAIRRVQKAVDTLSQAIHGLDVKGDYADQWKTAVTTFDTTSQECKRNCDQLAEAVAAHGHSTDTANANAATGYGSLAKAATGLV